MGVCAFVIFIKFWLNNELIKEKQQKTKFTNEKENSTLQQ